MDWKPKTLTEYRDEEAQKKGYKNYGIYLGQTYNNASDKWEDIIRSRERYILTSRLTQEVNKIRKFLEE